VVIDLDLDGDAADVNQDDIKYVNTVAGCDQIGLKGD